MPEHKSLDLSSKLTLTDLSPSDIQDKRVIIRVDFNVPISNDRIQDNTRLTESIPTILHILKLKPKYIVLLSHRGRPDGQINKKYTLQPIINEFNELLQQNSCQETVQFVDGVIEDYVKQTLDKGECKLYLLENVRFYIEEGMLYSGGDVSYAVYLSVAS